MSGVLAKRRQQIFMRRSYAIWKGIQQRVCAINDAGAAVFAVPLALANVRAFIQQSIGKGCFWCGATVTERTFSIDHFRPLADGGADAFDNYRVCCVACNRAKGSMGGGEFDALLASLRELDRRFPGMMRRVTTALKISNSFRFGADRRAKKGAG